MTRTDLEAIKAALEGALAYMNAVPVPPDTSLAVVIALTKRETNVRSALALVQCVLDEPAVDGWKAGAEAMRAQLKSGLSTRLNDWLCEMKEGYDDSIVGFNEAWDIMRKYLAELPLPLPPGGRT